MAKKTDLRIIKTETKLREALGEMMKEISFDDITVFQLCEKAEVRRATFYKHFNDKYDFLCSIVKTRLSELATKIAPFCNIESPVECFALYINGIIEYFDERPPILSNILGSSAFHVIFDIIVECTHSSVTNNLMRAKSCGSMLDVDIDVTASFINGGTATLLLSWFKNRTLSKEELLLKVKDLLKKFFE